MQITITVTGEPEVGKTELLDNLRGFLEHQRVSEETEVRMFEGDARASCSQHASFTVKGRSALDDETLAVVPREDGFWYVVEEGRCVAAAVSRDDADLLRRIVRASPLKRMAIENTLDGKFITYTPAKVEAQEVEPDKNGTHHHVFFDENDQLAAQAIGRSLDRILASAPLDGHQKTVVRHATKLVKHVGYGVGVVAEEDIAELGLGHVLMPEADAEGRAAA